MSQRQWQYRTSKGKQYAGRRQSKDILEGELLEKGLQETIHQAAKLTGWKYYHTYDSRRSPEGFPDLTLVHPVTHHLIFWELKRTHGKVTEAQHAWLEALSQVTQPPQVEVIRPCDLDACLKQLQELA